MAFFGRRRTQAGASIPLPLPPSGSALGKPEDAIPPHERQAVRAGGMFGRKRLPRTLQVIGATMRQMSGQAPGAIAEFTDAEAAAAERQRAEDMLYQENVQRKTQAQVLEEAISQLPPDQQAWARMNPEAYMEALMRRRMDTNNGWNVGQGYSHAFRVNPDGTLQQGAALPLRPRAPIQGYMVPYDDGTVYTDELPEDLR